LKGWQLALTECQAANKESLLEEKKTISSKTSSKTKNESRVSKNSLKAIILRLVRMLSHLGVTIGAGGAFIVLGGGTLGVSATMLLILLGNAILTYTFGRLLRDPKMNAIDEALANGVFPSSMAVPPSVVSAVLMFDSPPEAEELKRIIVEKLPRYKRFASVPVPNSTGLGMTWEERDISPDSHVFVHDANNRAGVRKIINEICLSPLRDPDLPRWEAHLIRNSNGRSALIARVDHCIGDGVSFASAFLDLTTQLDGSVPEPPAGFKRREKSFLPSLTRLASLGRAVGEVVALPFSGRDTPTPFRPDLPLGATGTERVILTVPDLSLEMVKAMKNNAGVTVNDILLSAFSGAVKRYLDTVDDRPSVALPARHMRALLPVAFPRRTPEGERRYTDGVKNLWSFASIPLAVSPTSTRLERLKDTHEATTALKNSPAVFVQKIIQDSFYHFLPQFLSRHLCADLMSKHSICFSNVPGPQKPLAVAGKEIVAVEAIFPNVLPQINLFSYNGRIYGNMILDSVAIPSPNLVSEFFEEEIYRLAMAVGVDPADHL